MLCVIGLDYLSTLAYQPSIAFGAAGRLAPLVTVLVACVTLFLALPVYWYIAGRSPHGGGSTALLERVIPGWFGKLLVLVLLAFGAVDLVFTRTFSAAAAAEHLTFNPHPEWQQALDSATRRARAAAAAARLASKSLHRGAVAPADGGHAPRVALGTIAGLIFFGATRGTSSGSRWSLSLFYLAVKLIVVGSGVAYLARPPAVAGAVVGRRVGRELEARGGGAAGGRLGRPARRVRPAVPGPALGLSGFELTLMAMPLVRGEKDDNPEKPRGVIRNTRVLLAVAAVTMSRYLLASTLVTTVLIPPAAQERTGRRSTARSRTWPTGCRSPTASRPPR